MAKVDIEYTVKLTIEHDKDLVSDTRLASHVLNALHNRTDAVVAQLKECYNCDISDIKKSVKIYQHFDLKLK